MSITQPPTHPHSLCTAALYTFCGHMDLCCILLPEPRSYSRLHCRQLALRTPFGVTNLPEWLCGHLDLVVGAVVFRDNGSSSIVDSHVVHLHDRIIDTLLQLVGSAQIMRLPTNLPPVALRFDHLPCRTCRSSTYAHD